MTAVAGPTVTLIPACVTAARDCHWPFQAASPLIVAPPSLASVLVTLPRGTPARVIISALVRLGLPGTIVTVALAALAPWVLLMIVTWSCPGEPMQ